MHRNLFLLIIMYFNLPQYESWKACFGSGYFSIFWSGFFSGLCFGSGQYQPRYATLNKNIPLTSMQEQWEPYRDVEEVPVRSEQLHGPGRHRSLLYDVQPSNHSIGLNGWDFCLSSHSQFPLFFVESSNFFWRNSRHFAKKKVAKVRQFGNIEQGIRTGPTQTFPSCC